MGLLSSFDHLDTISPEAIASWLKNAPSSIQLENYLANRILYPQALPLTAYQMQIDLAILREAIKINAAKGGNQKVNPLFGVSHPCLNALVRKILIPASLVDFVPDLTSLAWAVIDALLLGRKKESWLQDLWTIVLIDRNEEIAGSVLLPQLSNKGVMQLGLAGKQYKIYRGELLVIPCAKERYPIACQVQNGHIFGRTDAAFEIYGGKLGLMVDGRSL